MEILIMFYGFRYFRITRLYPTRQMTFFFVSEIKAKD